MNFTRSLIYLLKRPGKPIRDEKINVKQHTASELFRLFYYLEQSLGAAVGTSTTTKN